MNGKRASRTGRKNQTIFFWAINSATQLGKVDTSTNRRKQNGGVERMDVSGTLLAVSEPRKDTDALPPESAFVDVGTTSQVMLIPALVQCRWAR